VTPFRYYLRVRYIECDAQKVVFNSRYAEYVDVSVTEFLRAAGVLHEFLDGDLDFQLVNQTVEWKAPARYDQVLELSVTPQTDHGSPFAAPGRTMPTRSSGGTRPIRT